MEKGRTTELYSKLQRDIDALVKEAEHVFDYMAEYSHDTHPEHVIDIDGILAEHSRRQKASLDMRLAEKRALMAKRHRGTRPQNEFPKAPRKVIIAPPRELHREVREYSELMKASRAAEKKAKFKPIRLLFRRLEY